MAGEVANQSFRHLSKFVAKRTEKCFENRHKSYTQTVVLHAEKMKNPYFDIEWIIDLIKEQEPDRTDLIEQLKKSDRKKWIRQPYIHFISGARPNQPGSEWQFEENIVLEHKSEGTIVLDILKDGRIGGIEFVNQIPHS